MALKILIIIAFLLALASTAHAQPFILFSRSRASKRRARRASLEREDAHVECVLNRTEIGILHSEYTYQTRADPNKLLCRVITNTFETYTNAPVRNLTTQGIRDMPTHLKEGIVANVTYWFGQLVYTQKNFPRTYKPGMNITATFDDVLKYDDFHCDHRLGRKQYDNGFASVLMVVLFMGYIFR
jgi:hypothetical protein